VVLVHGFTASPVTTRPLGQHLAAAGYTVEVPVLPGHGTSVRDLATTRYADWFAAVERLTRHVAERCDRVVVVGHSMGGTIALDLAARRPTLVDALVVINPQVLDPPGLLARAAPLLQHVLPSVPRRVAGLPVDDLALPGVSEHAYATVPPRAARSLLAELPRVRAQLLEVTVPLLVVRSLVDHTVDPANAVAVLDLVGSGSLRQVVCERSYHVPQLDHDRELVEDALLRFLEDVASTGQGAPGGQRVDRRGAEDRDAHDARDGGTDGSTRWTW
jgi:carboxylesterase